MGITQEDCVDSNQFDNLSRHIGEQTDRRGMLKTAAGGAMALLGLGALGRAVGAQDVSAEGGYKGQSCNKNSNCKKGLKCNSKGRCEYKKSCGGQKNDACKKTNDCCGGFRCKNKKCKKK